MIVGTVTAGSIQVQRSETAGGTTVVMEKVLQGASNGSIEIYPIPRGPAGMYLTSIDADNNDGVVRIRYTYQSQPTQGGGGGGGGGSASKTIRAISGATQSAPITMHPDFSSMYDRYAKTMRGGVVEWLDNAPQSGGALSTQSSSVNPMAGVQVYNKATAVFSETRFMSGRSSVNVAVGSVGKISNPPNVGGGNQWLSCGATITQVGGDYRIDEKWIRDDRGFITDIYS
jgi:hypothetical protein